MDKYYKEVAELLGSDVAEVLNEWLEYKLDSAFSTAAHNCKEDWLPYSVTRPTVPVVKKDRELPRGSIGSWDDFVPANNVCNQTDSTLTELNELRAENLALKQQLEFQKSKVDMLVKLLNK